MFQRNVYSSLTHTFDWNINDTIGLVLRSSIFPSQTTHPKKTKHHHLAGTSIVSSPKAFSFNYSENDEKRMFHKLSFQKLGLRTGNKH